MAGNKIEHARAFIVGVPMSTNSRITVAAAAQPIVLLGDPTTFDPGVASCPAASHWHAHADQS
jgi:hypothetical protein